MGDGLRPDRADEVFGDSAMWWGSLPVLFQGLAFPSGPWRPPARPRAGDGSRFDYWNPLLHLLLGPLGWGDPALGIRRWIRQGMPVRDSATYVLRRWWGEDASMIVEWDSHEHRVPTMIAQQVAESSRAGSIRGATRRPGAGTDPRQWPAHWNDVLSGGWDPLHLSSHVGPMLVSPNPESGEGRLLASDGASRSVLLLPQYRGWLRLVHESPTAGPVDVVVLPLGWLGTYRRGAGRMHAASEEMHLLGW